jgi:Holliday junction resolvase
MSTPEKQKGDRAERAIVEWLHSLGFTKAHRIRAGSPDDVGDIELGLPGVVIEVKDRGKLDLPAWIRKLGIQKANKDAALGVIVIKKRGSSDPFEWSYVIDAATLVNILTAREFLKRISE